MERLTIEEVAEIIGDTPHEIRKKCKYDMYDPPICRKVMKPGGKQPRYQFFKGLVYRYVGRDQEYKDPVQELHDEA